MAIVSGICDRVSSQSRAKRRGWTLPSINYLFSPIGATLTGIVVAWLTGVLVGGGALMDVKGDLIRQIRLQRGWTQQQLAEIADVSLRTIQRVENQGVASNESVSALSAVMERPREEILAPSADPEVRARAERQVAWMVPVALAFGTLAGSGVTFLVMYWLGG